MIGGRQMAKRQRRLEQRPGERFSQTIATVVGLSFLVLFLHAIFAPTAVEIPIVVAAPSQPISGGRLDPSAAYPQTVAARNGGLVTIPYRPVMLTTGQFKDQFIRVDGIEYFINRDGAVYRGQ